MVILCSFFLFLFPSLLRLAFPTLVRISPLLCSPTSVQICKCLALSFLSTTSGRAWALVSTQSLSSRAPSSEPATSLPSSNKGRKDLVLTSIGILQEVPQITTRNSNLYKLYRLVERKEKREFGRYGRVVSGHARVQGRRGNVQAREATRT